MIRFWSLLLGPCVLKIALSLSFEMNCVLAMWVICFYFEFVKEVSQEKKTVAVFGGNIVPKFMCSYLDIPPKENLFPFEKDDTKFVRGTKDCEFDEAWLVCKETSSQRIMKRKRTGIYAKLKETGKLKRVLCVKRENGHFICESLHFDQFE